MRTLSLMDQVFLRAERRTTPLHAGLLYLLRPPEGSDRMFVARLAGRLRQSAIAYPPYNLREPLRLGRRSRWSVEDDLDMAQHFRHLALPAPGRIRELLVLVSRLQSTHLDRAYPLWNMTLIEGLEDGRMALFVKIHHALADGVGTMRLMAKAMSTVSAEASVSLPPPWSIPSNEEDSVIGVPLPVGGSAARVLGVMRNRMTTIPTVAGHLLAHWRERRAGNPAVVSSTQAPDTIINTKITASRRFAAQSYAMSRIRGIAAATAASTNDVVLAITGSALRNYLQSLDALPDEPLVAVVPVSVRRDASETGNEIAVALVNLATESADPLSRLARVKACMDHNKAVHAKLTPAQIQAYALGLLLPGALAVLNPWRRRRGGVNVVISHVPVARTDLYWQGCAVDGIYPASLIVDTMALNITVVSRRDAVDFGIIACRKTLPNIQRLLEGIEHGIVELEQALSAMALAQPVASAPVGPVKKGKSK